MKTTKPNTTHQLPPFEISPLYSDCTIQVPLDDGSGFHTYNLHLCMLCESPYFEQMVPNPKKVHLLPTLKTHFDYIIRYIYDKSTFYYASEFILDLITEAYRFSLDPVVSRLWSIFVRIATPKMVIEALKCIENQREFHKRWDQSSLRMAIRRNILGLFDLIRELKTPKCVQLLVDSANTQNPEVVAQKLLHWVLGSRRMKPNPVMELRTAYLKNYDYLNLRGSVSKDGHLTRSFTVHKFNTDTRSYAKEMSVVMQMPCVVGSTLKIQIAAFKIVNLTIQSLSPLTVLLTVDYFGFHVEITRFMVRLWNKDNSFYINKTHRKDGCLDYEIYNAHEWTQPNSLKLKFEVISWEGSQINKLSRKIDSQPPAFNRNATREKLSADFTVECVGEGGPVVYKLNKFILQKSPHFKRMFYYSSVSTLQMFSMSSFIEAKTNKATIETSKVLFEIILRYLYNQDPLKGISSIITDVILEASYFELNDFENELWSLFEREADATNCIKAINLIDVNMHFKVRESNVMKVVAKNIKAVLKNIDEVPDWTMVRSILNLECTKKQNPMLVLKSISLWCLTHDPEEDDEKRICELSPLLIGERVIPPMIVKDIQAAYPFLTDLKTKEESFNSVQTFIGGSNSEFSITSDNKIIRKNEKEDELRLHDKLSQYYIVVQNGTVLSQVVENIEEWKYGGNYRISIASNLTD